MKFLEECDFNLWFTYFQPNSDLAELFSSKNIKLTPTFLIYIKLKGSLEDRIIKNNINKVYIKVYKLGKLEIFFFSQQRKESPNEASRCCCLLDIYNKKRDLLSDIVTTPIKYHQKLWSTNSLEFGTSCCLLLVGAMVYFNDYTTRILDNTFNSNKTQAQF